MVIRSSSDDLAAIICNLSLMAHCNIELLFFFLKEMPIKAFIHIHETIQSLAQLGHLQNLSSKGQAPM